MQKQKRATIPFFPNTGDGTHCFQAALMMALAVLKPQQKFSYDELDKISAKLPGKWTWPTSAMLWMLENGLQIKLIEEFDYRSFVDEGIDYLIERYGKEVGEAQGKNSDIEREREIARRFISHAPLEYRIPTVDDIKKELGGGSVVLVNLNAAALHGVEGYSGHFVVIVEVKNDVIILHDPGIPPNPNFKVKLTHFEKAWGYPTERDRNLLSIKLS